MKFYAIVELEFHGSDSTQTMVANLEFDAADLEDAEGVIDQSFSFELWDSLEIKRLKSEFDV